MFTYKSINFLDTVTDKLWGEWPQNCVVLVALGSCHKQAPPDVGRMNVAADAFAQRPALLLRRHWRERVPVHGAGLSESHCWSFHSPAPAAVEEPAGYGLLHSACRKLAPSGQWHGDRKLRSQVGSNLNSVSTGFRTAMGFEKGK